MDVHPCGECGFEYDLGTARAAGPAIVRGVGEIAAMLSEPDVDVRILLRNVVGRRGRAEIRGEGQRAPRGDPIQLRNDLIDRLRRAATSRCDSG